VSPLYLYAIVGRAPAAALGSGLRDEPLVLVAAGDVVAVAGEMDEPPAATPDTVRGHDAVVRRLAAASDAILPARFGTLADAPALIDWLAAAEALPEALRLVAGREQMTLHVFGDARLADEATDEASLGPGTRYLAERRRHWQRTESLPELAPLRRRLGDLVAAERVEPRAAPPLRASVYHLIARGRSGDYRDAVEQELAPLAGVRLRLSGPWAPYAFVPEAPSASTVDDR
jgi:hypothetical protein